MVRKNTKQITIILLISFFLIQGAAFTFATPPAGNDPTPPPPPGNDPTPPPGNDPTPPPGNDPVPPPPAPPAPPAPIPTVDIKANNSDGPITISYNTSANLTWNSSNADSCHASGDWLGVKSTSGTEATGNLTAVKTYTISCTGPGGSASDSVTINAGQPPLSLVFTSNPAVGNAPLSNVDLIAQVGGTAIGDILYQFDCTGDGIWEREITTSFEDYTALDLCSYSSLGIFTPKAKITRAGFTIEGTTIIIVE